MPKTIYFPKDAQLLSGIRSQNSGINITWTASAQRLDISGWYDGCVGISGTAITLSDFFELFGITERDCIRAFQKREIDDSHR